MHQRAPHATYVDVTGRTSSLEKPECHGGPGYIEESIMPRLYREAPVNSIWEGSGNIMCLDVLRAMGREPAAVPALLAELEAARGGKSLLDAATEKLKDELADPENLELRARSITELMAVTLQETSEDAQGHPGIATRLQRQSSTATAPTRA